MKHEAGELEHLRPVCCCSPRLPLAVQVLANRAPRGKVSALVLSPTRELARQIQTETHKMLTYHPGLHSMVVYGGVDVKKNLRALVQKMPDILIATPGRCWDIMTQAHVSHGAG